ncbi:MAG: diaminopimelate epimerase [Actinobacteria bacterium]|nr:diaminopimelate epimerase [Actinomycetota bacterium]
MPRVRLTKLEATGNDFLVFVDLAGEHAPTPEEVRSLCNRAIGVGADGLIRILPGHDGAELAMELTNADGGRAEMSGNGMRCLAALALREGLVSGLHFRVATDAGIRTVEWSGAEAPEVRVDMGSVTFDPAEIPLTVDSAFGLTAEVDGFTYEGDAAGIGNPHLVLFVDDPLAVPVERHGARLEHDSRFPHRVNVEFVHVESPDLIRMRVWERGVGETRSCGTGACAAVAAAHRRGLVGELVKVEVPGGTLVVELKGEGDGTIWLGGPVSFVGDVEVTIGEATA